jgi:hypothetical protein
MTSPQCLNPKHRPHHCPRSDHHPLISRRIPPILHQHCRFPKMNTPLCSPPYHLFTCHLQRPCLYINRARTLNPPQAPGPLPLLSPIVKQPYRLSQDWHLWNRMHLPKSLCSCWATSHQLLCVRTKMCAEVTLTQRMWRKTSRSIESWLVFAIAVFRTGSVFIVIASLT